MVCFYKKTRMLLRDEEVSLLEPALTWGIRNVFRFICIQNGLLLLKRCLQFTVFFLHYGEQGTFATW